jgi:magnesium and cobalt transporter
LVGDIAEPERRPEPGIYRIGPARWRADAAADIGDLEAATDAELPAGDWNTVGGLLIADAGRIPERGEEFEIGGLRFLVLDARPQRIVTVEVSILSR